MRTQPIVEEVELRWDSQEVVEWKAVATEQQQSLCELLRNSPSLYGKNNRIDLEKKIAYAMYGPPERLPGDGFGTGYKKKQLKKIRSVSNLVFKNNSGSQISVSFLFICVYMKNVNISLPVLRVMTDKVLFVDFDHRIYQSWNDFLKNNKLPKCFVCYPRDGIYTEVDGSVDVEFGESPACSLPEKVLNILDITVSVTAAALGVTALAIPFSSPVVIAAAVGGLASGIFGVSRSARTLVDRHNHGQTLGLNSEEARSSWLGVVGNTVGLALGSLSAASSRIAQGARGVVGLSAGAASLSIGAAAVKGLSVVDHIANIGKKLTDEEQVTILDAFQMVSSVFFFTGSVVSTQSAFRTLENLHSLGTNVKMNDILKMIQNRHNLGKEIVNYSSTIIDGEPEIEEPEVIWPAESKVFKCTIL
ncbi:hypothetical protein C0J52_02676 [Blattella germanica]|nr:hypothetical protein C0J52_02676 [Blattella germanica]